VNQGLIGANVVEQAVGEMGRKNIVQLMNVKTGKRRQLLKKREK
jgi:hypothetical protein